MKNDVGGALAIRTRLIESAASFIDANQMQRHAAPFSFLPIGLIIGWASGVATIPLGYGLTKAGFSVGQSAPIVAAWTLPMAMMFLWAPLVDCLLSRKLWMVSGSSLIGASIFALYATVWRPSNEYLLIGLALSSGLGSSLVSAATKGIMAYHVDARRLGLTSAFYQAGSVLGIGGGSATGLWLMGRVSNAALLGLFLAVIPVFCALSILFLPPEDSSIGRGRLRLLDVIKDVIKMMRTHAGLMAGLVCIVPFGGGGAATLFGTIAPEWHASSDLMAGISAAAALVSVLGAFIGAWIIARSGYWTSYIVAGCLMITVALGLALVPENALSLSIGALFYALASGAAGASIYTIALSTIGRGAASTKASVLVGLSNIGAYYPPLIEGAAHDHGGSTSLMLTEAALGFVGLLLILSISKALQFSLRPMAA